MQQNAAQNISAQSSGSVTVHGVLGWTEFYNGKWQLTRTSDVNEPTTIGVFDPALQRVWFALAAKLSGGPLVKH